MNRMIKQTLLAFGAVLALVTVVFTVPVQASPLTQFAAGSGCSGTALLGFPTWYDGLQCDGNKPKMTALTDIWIVALNVVQWIIIATGYVAVFMIIYGGFRYMTSGGSLGNDKTPGKIAAAKNTIVSAIVGLILAMSAVMILKYVQKVIAG